MRCMRDNVFDQVVFYPPHKVKETFEAHTSIREEASRVFSVSILDKNKVQL